MGCHVMDAAFWSLKLKYPTSVQASRSYDVQKMWTRFENKETYPRAEVVHYEFPARAGMPPVKLHWYDGGILPERPDDLEPSRRIPRVFDLRRHQGQDHVWDVQRKPAHFPGNEDARV